MKLKDQAKARDILAATLEEVEAVGLSGLSMAAVARRAHLATGTLYVYFKDKEALIEALYVATKHELAEMVFKDELLPVRAAFSRMCVAYMQYLAEHRSQVVFMRQVTNSQYVSPRARAGAALETRALTELLERGKRELLLKELDTPFLVAFLHGTLSEMASVARSSTRAQRARRFDQVAQLCWDALKA